MSTRSISLPSPGLSQEREATIQVLRGKALLESSVVPVPLQYADCLGASAEKVEALMDSIKEVGLKEPVSHTLRLRLLLILATEESWGSAVRMYGQAMPSSRC